MLHLIAIVFLVIVTLTLLSASRAVARRIGVGLRGSLDSLRRWREEAKNRRETRKLKHEALNELAEIESKLESRSVAAKDLDERFSRIDTMDGGEFEGLIFRIFQALGYKVRRSAGSGDQGVDVLAEKDGLKVAIQCKRHARPVGNRAVQEVYAGVRFYDADEGWVVASNGYTDGASALATVSASSYTIDVTYDGGLPR